VARYEFQAPYPPSVNSMYRHAGRFTYKSAAAKAYVNALQGAFLQRYGAMPVQLTGALKLTLDVYRPQKRGDLDNIFKGVQDSMNEFLFTDDSQIIEIHARRYDAPKIKGVKTMGWVDVTIEEIE
jgi:Holliday junction resolvase RusA-like endonuclease